MNGKTPAVAMNAVMRKRIVILNAEIRDAPNALKNMGDDKTWETTLQ
jgi:hypothetical protein